MTSAVKLAWMMGSRSRDEQEATLSEAANESGDTTGSINAGLQATRTHTYVYKTHNFTLTNQSPVYRHRAGSHYQQVCVSRCTNIYLSLQLVVGGGASNGWQMRMRQVCDVSKCTRLAATTAGNLMLVA